MTEQDKIIETQKFQPADEDKGKRLDSYLTEQFEDFSRSRLKDLVKQGQVRLGGATIVEPNYRVKPGDEISICLPPPEDPIPKPENIPLDIAYEDDDVIVVNKPAGLVVHPAAGHWKGTLVNALIHHCGDSLSGIGGVKRPGIVHRLDKDTSGLLVVAKNDRAHKGLASQFADHSIDGPLQRRYQAFVWRTPARPKGTVDLPLARSEGNRQKISVRDDGRHAVTHYRLLEKFGDEAALVECQLETGRTHQIRVHMAQIGHPLIGDDTYGSGFKSKANILTKDAQDAIKNLGRQALHAAILGFEHPVSGEKLSFESPLPDDLIALKNALNLTANSS